jgi:hypothetical protein
MLVLEADSVPRMTSCQIPSSPYLQKRILFQKETFYSKADFFPEFIITLIINPSLYCFIDFIIFVKLYFIKESIHVK